MNKQEVLVSIDGKPLKLPEGAEGIEVRPTMTGVELVYQVREFQESPGVIVRTEERWVFYKHIYNDVGQEIAATVHKNVWEAVMDLEGLPSSYRQKQKPDRR